jgi:protein-tyrosine phosphatase
MPSILFVCTANMFRSPLASAILQKEIDKWDNPLDWILNSAGTWTTNGLQPPEITRKMSKRLKLAGVENHRTRQVDRNLLENTDLIIVMETNHKEAIISEFPTIKDRVFLLTEIVEGKAIDIPDPSSPGIEATEVADLLVSLISIGVDKILEEARTKSRNHNSNIR